MSEDEVMKKFSESLAGMDKDPNMEGVMEQMMGQLLSKEFLYEPLTEMASKYPPWLKENEGKISAEDRERYRKQLGVVKQIVQVFDEEPDSTEKVVVLLQDMQACGQPPPEIMKDVGGGVELDDQGNPKMPEQCAVM
uniref:Peroxin-19 n=1 Tax=Hemiselmis andersenii TaxID=464988 RepID=A0A7S1DL99_HEMAN